MSRAALLVLLVASILCSGSAEAQRGGGVVFWGGTAPMGVDGQRGLRSGVFASRPHVRHFHNPASVFLPPFWYDGGFVDEEPYPEEVVNTPPRVVVVQTDRQQSPEPQAPAAKLIEVPGAATAAVATPASPAIFILTDGQRLESRRYVLTADELRVAIDRQQRTMVIPLSTLDLDATVAANRERGIELRIPTDRSEITLSF